ncbi:MAG: GntR family transcriptional regulator [Bacillota bacterium]|jgi:GntR family transcriptional regulator|uniref:GntR family transcriptional regulator n=1 Tax=Bacillus sp. RO2 TaxID=2723913 RepID=UPI00145DECC5|nr:GntR family transcriptional regulator [Bacillus sp. RO2]MEA3322423.1 GntR family transcriptional regulator [Bacillota bacterium]NMH71716.1 GntR family transcriptional regulator [Bacillus sp. RO2]
MHQQSNKQIALYLQIKETLIQRIQEKIWLPNKLIPTEQELMKEFEVSRTTIRQAISMMVQDGLLERQQGRGTIVKSQQLVGSLGRLKGFAEEVLERGLTPNSQLIRAEFSTDLYHEKAMLQTDDKSILVIERIRFADNLPIAYERSCWPKSIGEKLMKEELNQANFYQILEQNGIALRKANEKISAMNATMHEADLLGIRAGEALIEMTRLSYGIDDKPIEYTRTKFRSDQYHYNVELTR